MTRLLHRFVVPALIASTVPLAARAQSAAPPPPPSQSPPPSEAPVAQPAPVFAPQPGVVYVDAYGRPVYMAPPPTQPAPQEHLPMFSPMRGTIGLSASALIFADSSFREASHAWGYSGFTTAAVFAIDGGIHVNRFLLVGARVGYSSVGGGTANYDNAALTMDMFDFDAIVRAGAPLRLGHNWVFFPGAQLEFGGLYADLHLRSASNDALLARVAGEAMVMFASPHVGLSVRLGYQFAEWDHTDGDLTLLLAGLTLGLGLEVRL